MGQLDSIFNATDKYLSQVITGSINKRAELVNEMVDSELAEQWQNMNYTYDAENFDRQRISDKQEYDRKCELLQKMNIPYATTLIGGDAVLEIPKEIDQSQTSNLYKSLILTRIEEDRREQEEKQNAKNDTYQFAAEQKKIDDHKSEDAKNDVLGISEILEKSDDLAKQPSELTGTVSSQSIFNMLNTVTETDTYGYQGEKYDNSMQYMSDRSPFRPQESILNNLDTFGYAVSLANRAYGTVKSYGDDESDVFVKGTHSTGKSKEALVVDGEIIIDGQILGSPNSHFTTDQIKSFEGQKEHILQEHQYRIDKAHDLANNSIFEVKRENALKIENSLYDGALRSDIQTYTVRGGEESIKTQNAYENIVKNINQELSIIKVKSKAIEGLENSHMEQIITVVASKAYPSGLVVSIPAKDAVEKFRRDGVNARLTVNEKDKISQTMNAYAGKMGDDIAVLENKLLSVKKDTDEYKELQSKLNALKVEQDGYRAIGSKFALNDSERTFLNAQIKTVNSLNKDFGMHISADNYLTTKDLVEINKKFIAKAEAKGINVVKKDGFGKYKIDVEFLKGLDKKGLKELGLSKGSVDFIANMNAAGADKSGITSLGGLIYSGFLRIDDSQDWAEFRRDMRNIKSAGKHTKNTIVNVRKYREMRQKEKLTQRGIQGGWKHKAELAKKNAERNAKNRAGKKLSEEKVKRANEKAINAFEKGVKKAETSKINKISRKIEAKKGKAIRKLTNPNKRVGRTVGRFFKLTDNFNLAKKAIMKKVRALALKAGGSILGLLAPLGGVVVCAIIVITLIQSLLSQPFELVDKLLAPSSYEETVAYKLYAYMDGQEAVWLDQVLCYESKSSGNAYENRAELKYGMNASDFQTYIRQNCNKELAYDGDTLYINPFANGDLARVSYDSNGKATLMNKDYLTKVSGYDGKFDFTLSANANSYDRKISNTKGAEYLTFLSCERGHTKNAKDILCMTDVMYQFRMDEFFNDEGGEFYSILGKSPAQVNWENFHNKFVKACKWVWEKAKQVVNKVVNFFKGLFGGKKSEDYVVPDFTVYVSGGSVGYEAIQSYVAALFNGSHQQAIGLGVEYYPVGNVTVKSGGKVLNITDDISQQQASEFGVCKSPVTNKFKVAVFQNGKVAPYLTQEGSSVKFALDENKYKVNITMANMASDDLQCVWVGMGSNKTTFDKIINFMNKKKDTCWKKESSKPYGDPKKTRLIYNSQWYDAKDISKAKEAVNKAVLQEYNNYKLPADQYKITAYDAPNSKNVSEFSRWTSSKPTYKVEYSVYATRQTVAKYEYDYYWMEFDGKTVHKTTMQQNYNDDTLPKDMKEYYDKFFKNIEKKHTNTTVKGKYTKRFDTQDNQRFNPFVLKSVTTVRDDKKEFNYNDIGDDADIEIPITYVVRKRPVYKTQYKYQGYANVEQRYTEIYKHNCKGHNFKYCGGHVCYHSQGIVYSMTNEQILMSGALPEQAEAPQVLGYNLESHQYDEVRGKHYNVDYSTLSTAISTGLVKDPWSDPQGSYIGSKKGLELWVRDPKNAEGWLEQGDGEDDKEEKGAYLRVCKEYRSAVNRTRDIFDVDTGIEKTSSVFPIKKTDYKSFEGWTADNIISAAAKLSVDWTDDDLYGFDIPLEISQRNAYLNYGRSVSYSSKDEAEKDIDDSTGRYKKAEKLAQSDDEKTDSALKKNDMVYAGMPLTDKDIKRIVDALKNQYGPIFTEEREKAVRTALGWVGRAHYSDYHTEHDFLCSACKSNGADVYIGDGKNKEWRIVREYNCTASNSLGFARYVYKKNGTDVNSWSTKSMVTAYADASNMMPADIIYHKGIYKSSGEIDINKVDFKGATVNDFKNYLNVTYLDVQKKDNVVDGKEAEYFTSVIKKDCKDNAVVFIGKLGNPIYLDSGKTINKGAVLTVELQSINDIGNVWLHYEKGNSLFGGTYSTNPYWVTHPDDRTYVKKFEERTVFVGR